MLQPAMGRRLPSSHCCLTPRRHARAVNGLQATPPLLGAVRSLDVVACGCAATPDPPEWSQAGARPNYRSCSLELGRRRLLSPTAPPQPVALVLAERTREKMCSGWTLDCLQQG